MLRACNSTSYRLFALGTLTEGLAAAVRVRARIADFWGSLAFDRRCARPPQSEPTTPSCVASPLSGKGETAAEAGYPRAAQRAWPRPDIVAIDSARWIDADQCRFSSTPVNVA